MEVSNDVCEIVNRSEQMYNIASTGADPMCGDTKRARAVHYGSRGHF